MKLSTMLGALILALAVTLSSGIGAAPKPTPKPAPVNIQETLSQATLAVYAAKQVCGWSEVQTFFGPMKIWSCDFAERFVCTATVVGADADGGYVGLTAGHCIDREWLATEKVKYYVSDSVSGKPVLHEITLMKFENDERYDYAIFTFKSLTEYPAMPVFTGVGTPALGTRVINVNYSMGIVKQVVEGPVTSHQIGELEGNKDAEVRRRFLAQLPVGPGASGSAVVDEQTGEIVGLVEAGYTGTQMSAIIIPTGTNLSDFVQDDSAGIAPEPEPVTPNNTAPEKFNLWKFLMWLVTGF